MNSSHPLDQSDKRAERLVNEIIFDEFKAASQDVYARALEYALHFLGVSPKELTEHKPGQSLRNYLDSNDIPFREIATPADLTSSEHPSLLVASLDASNVYFHNLSSHRDSIYSSLNDEWQKDLDTSTVSQTAYEIYATLPDVAVGLSRLSSFVLYGLSRSVVLAIVVSIITVSLYLLIPLFTEPLITQIIPNRSVGILTQSTIGFALMLGVTSVTSYLQDFILIRIETVSDIRTQTALWDRLIRLPITFLSQYSVGDLNSRVDAVTRIRQLLSSTVIQSALNAIFSLAYIGIIFFISPVLSILLVLALLSLLLILSFLIYLDFKLQLPIYEQEASVMNFSLQMLSSFVSIRANLSQKRVLVKWLESIQAISRLYMRSKFYDDTAIALSSFFSYLSISFISLFVFIYSSFAPTFYLERDLTSLAAKFLTVLVTFKALLTSLTGLVSTTGTTFAQVYVQWKRSKPIFDEQVESGYSTSAEHRSLHKYLSLVDISYTYRGQNAPIFTNVNMQFDVGRYTAITGPSGCGKSTLLKILIGLIQPTKGQVLVDGIPLTELNIRTLRRDIGIVPQNLTLFSGSLKSNLCSGLDYSDDQIWNSLELADIADKVHALPMKLETVVMGGSGSFSGGETQRLLIARALISEPKLLIFDEATSALDPLQQETIIKNVLNTNTSLIAVAHRLSTIRSADVVHELRPYITT